MLHRYRSVMVRPGRDRLTGDVEVDEAFLGGPEPGITGRGALGKVLFAAAVELNSPRGLGRVRLGVIQDAGADSLRQTNPSPPLAPTQAASRTGRDHLIEGYCD